jgi:hypothetical protein
MVSGSFERKYIFDVEVLLTWLLVLNKGMTEVK